MEPSDMVKAIEAASEEEVARAVAEADAVVRGLQNMGPITLTLQPAEAMAVLAQLQLAQTHPENVGVGAAYSRSIALKLQEHLSADPALARACERGWRMGGDESDEVQ